MLTCYWWLRKIQEKSSVENVILDRTRENGLTAERDVNTLSSWLHMLVQVRAGHEQRGRGTI